MQEQRANLGAFALARANELQTLIDILNNTTTANLLAEVEYLKNIDTTVLQANTKSIPLIFLLKAMQDDVNYLKSIDFNTLFSFEQSIDGLMTTIESSKNLSQQSADISTQAKDAVVNTINNASIYDPTKQERRYKADFFGIKLL